MSSFKKRKAEERTFFKKWEETYLFIENMGKPLCLVCQKTVSATKEYNLKRHYDTLYKHKFEKYEECFAEFQRQTGEASQYDVYFVSS